MRTGQLKSLLAVLRAAGVSEFSDSKSGVSVRLGPSVPVAATASKGKKAERELQTSQQELVNELTSSKAAQKALLQLGVDAETAARELVDVS